MHVDGYRIAVAVYSHTRYVRSVLQRIGDEIGHQLAYASCVHMRSEITAALGHDMTSWIYRGKLVYDFAYQAADVAGLAIDPNEAAEPYAAVIAQIVEHAGKAVRRARDSSD